MSFLKVMKNHVETAATVATLNEEQAQQALKIIVEGIGGRKNCEKVYLENLSNSKRIKFYGIESNINFKKLVDELNKLKIPHKTSAAGEMYGVTNLDSISLRIPKDFDYKPILNMKVRVPKYAKAKTSKRDTVSQDVLVEYDVSNKLVEIKDRYKISSKDWNILIKELSKR